MNIYNPCSSKFYRCGILHHVFYLKPKKSHLVFYLHSLSDFLLKVRKRFILAVDRLGVVHGEFYVRKCSFDNGQSY